MLNLQFITQLKRQKRVGRGGLCNCQNVVVSLLPPRGCGGWDAVLTEAASAVLIESACFTCVGSGGGVIPGVIQFPAHGYLSTLR